MSNPNLAILELVAGALGPVFDDVVFVGGCATGLLLTQVRPTASASRKTSTSLPRRSRPATTTPLKTRCVRAASATTCDRARPSAAGCMARSRWT